MNTELQYVTAIAIITIAAAYVLWAVVARFWSRGKSCGSACSGCGSSEKSLGEIKSFVEIESISRPPQP